MLIKSFNPATGLMVILAARPALGSVAATSCFNPATGLMVILATLGPSDLRKVARFNPATGLMVILAEVGVDKRKEQKMFQSRDWVDGYSGFHLRKHDSVPFCFNPATGLMVILAHWRQVSTKET